MEKTFKKKPSKALSLLLSVMMIITSLSVGFSAFAAEAPELPSDNSNNPTALTNNTLYKVTQNMTITGGTNGLSVPANATVIIDIAAGVTLTVKGSAANGTSAGKAGILMNNGSKLIFTGAGTSTLVVSGGKGGNGNRGGNNSGTTGGTGGAGGAGGGAGIGTNGGASGSAAATWPTDATVTVLCGYANNTPNSNNGSNGSAGTQGSGSSDGGAGGGGGAGKGGAGIGTGGGGGKAGGNGTNGSSGCSSSRGTTGGTGAAGANPAAYSFITDDPFASMRGAINDNSAYYSMTMAELLAIGTATLTAVKTALNTPYNALINTYGKNVYDYYFGSYNTAATIQNIEEAIAMADNIALARWLQTKSADEVDYNASYQVLNTLWSEFDAKYQSYKDLSDETRSFLEDEGYIDVSAVEAKLDEYRFAMDVANLRENYYDLITGDVATFSAYDLDWVAETEGASGILSAAKDKVSSYITTLDGLDQNAVNAVFGDGYAADVLQPLLGNLVDLMYAAELKDQLAGYKNVYDTALAPVDLSANDNALYSVLNSYDGWYTELRAYIAALREFDEDFADKVFDDLDNVMTSKIDSIYATLNARVAANIDTAYNFYQGFVSVYGYTINDEDDVNVQNYTALRQIFNNISTAQYNFLVNSGNFDVPQEEQDKYELMRRALEAFEHYHATLGLSAYEFNKVPLEDITRVVTEYDVVRDQDYTVDEEKRAAVYEKVKELLDSDLVKGLLGDGLDLTTLADTLRETIFSDSLVNTLISMIYPIVIDNFAPVWATQLPETYGPIEKSGLKFTFQIKQNLCTLRQALEKLGLYALPNQLAALPVMNAFPEIKAKLAGVTYDPVYDAATETVTVNPWNDPTLVDEDGKLALEWGVHDKDSFINALSAGLAGVEPILLALLSNKTTNRSANIIGDGKTIEDSDSILFITVKVTLDPITLSMSFKGNDGFNNALAPILSALGAETIGDGKAMDTLRKLATGIATPLDEIINKLATDPIDFLLKALPNLAFAVNYGLVEPLLDQLKETITYSAVAHYTPSQCADPGDETAVAPTDISVDVGELLLGGLNLDLSTASGLVNSIVGLIGGDEEEAEPTEPTEPGEGEETSGGIADLLAVLPLDDLFEMLAFSGDSVTWKTGYRSNSPFTLAGNETDFPYIVAAPSNVFARLVNYLLELLKTDETLLPALVDALGLEVDLTDEDSLIVGILNKVLADPDPAIAAIVELMLPVDYSHRFKPYNWKESDFTYNVPALSAPDVAYLKYANNWTLEKAEQLVEGSGDLVDSLMPMLGQEGTLSDVLGGLIGGALNNETVASLKDTLAGLGETLGSAADLLQDVLGIDLGAFAEIEYTSFEDGDVAGFFTALKELLAPLSPVVAILFDQDFTALDGAITIKGYDTYSNAIEQLFGALGAEPIDVANTAPEDMLGAILDAIGARVAALLSGNVVKNILGLLPNLVYFLESNGLGTALYNLLLPIQVVLDVIRPIYDLNLMETVMGLLSKDSEGEGEGEEEDGGFAAILADLDLESLTFTDIIGIVDNKLGTQLVGTALTTYAVPALYADKTGDMVGTFTTSVSEADTLTILLSGVLEAFLAETDSGKTNGEIVIAKIAGDDAEKQEKYVGIYNGVVNLLTGEETAVEYQVINWDYMYGDGEIDLANFKLPDETDPDLVNYLLYQNNWNEDVADYLDENFDAIVNEIVASLKDGSDLKTILEGLLNDKLYTDEVANAVINAIGGLLNNVGDGLRSAADLLLGTELQGATFEPVEGITKDTFVDTLCDTLAPLDSILSFALFGGSYKFLHHSDDFGSDLLTLSGGEAYRTALVPLLEALGVQNLPKMSELLKADGTYDGGAALRGVLEGVVARLDEITADPVNEILALLPNIIYFLNADGVKAVVNNLLDPFDGIIRMVTGKEDGALFDDIYGVAIDDLTTDNVLTLIENATADDNGEGGIKFSERQRNAFKRFYIGEAEKIDSAVEDTPSFRMVYRTGDGATDRRDMITIVFSLLLDVLKYEENAKVLDKLPVNGLGETVYNLLHNPPFEPKSIEWKDTENADTETEYTPIENSELFTDGYGLLYTEEMAQYIADNFVCFVDDMIQLLGVQINGQFVTSLPELLESLVGSSLFTRDNVVKIGDLLKGYVGKINELPASAHIKEVIKRSLGVDIDAFMNYEPGEVTDKESFVTELSNMFTPFAPLLRWLLCDENISFFYDADGEHQIELYSADGYRNGVIPILEALFCEDVKTPEEFKALDDDELIPAILDPLFTRLDYILEDPAERIFEIMPNLVYFIDCNGVEACVKNITDPVQNLLNALEPALGQHIDIYGMIADKLGINPEVSLNFNTLIEALLNMLEEGTDISFDSLDIDAIKELVSGKLVSFTSANGETAYRMVFNSEQSRADMATSVLRILLRWIASSENGEKLKELIKEKVELPEDGYKYIDSLIDVTLTYGGTAVGMDSLLHSIYYIFYGIHTGAHEANEWLNSYNARFKFVNEYFNKSENDDLMGVAKLLDNLYRFFIDDNGSTGNVFSPEGLAPNGLIPFFQQIIEWFRAIIAKLQTLFGYIKNLRA